jgi:hypothetical protein
MTDELLSIKSHLEKKDLEKYCEILFNTVVKLSTEVNALKKQIEHLETLLLNVNVTEIKK